MFGEGEYGIIILQSANWDYYYEMPWNVTENNMREIIRRLKATGAVVVLWEGLPFWDLDGQITTMKDWCDIWGTHPEIACGLLDGETQTAAYYEAWGEDTLYSRIAEEEGAFFIPNSAFHDCIQAGCPAKTVIHPDMMDTDGRHLNGLGYMVVAERFAGYLVDWGLGEYVVDPGTMSQIVSVNLSLVDDCIKELGELNYSVPTEVVEDFEMARFLYENGHPHSAGWVLGDRVVPRVVPVAERWDEVQEMFSQARGCIETLKAEGKGRDAAVSQGDVSRAVKEWAEGDCERTLADLAKVIERCREGDLLPIIGCLVMAGLFRRGKKGF